MKISAVDIRPGNVLEHQGRLWAVTKTQHVQPGKGGAFMQVEMKDIKIGTKLNERFRSEDSVERVRLDEMPFQFLYANGDEYSFMNSETYESITLTADQIGEQADFLAENMAVIILHYQDEPISVQLPETVVLQVVEADAVVKGQTASSSYKPAKLSNGRRVMVPPFIESGTLVVVNTATGEYMKRAEQQ
jgi:elongation factor P